jgi:hypothetical protein
MDIWAKILVNLIMPWPSYAVCSKTAVKYEYGNSGGVKHMYFRMYGTKELKTKYKLSLFTPGLDYRYLKRTLELFNSTGGPCPKRILAL